MLRQAQWEREQRRKEQRRIRAEKKKRDQAEGCKQQEKKSEGPSEK
jgi:hypothetical protein